MFTREEILESWIPYRLQAIETLAFAWELANGSASRRRLQVSLEGRVVLEGNVAAIANPMIEAGVIHARALLEFLGLCVREGRLAQIPPRRKSSDDVAIEHYSTEQGPLSRITPEEAVASYAGPAVEAEKALLLVFYLANKGLAHFTGGIPATEFTDAHLDIACRGIPVLIHNHLYAKLGRTIPPPPEAKPYIG